MRVNISPGILILAIAAVVLDRNGILPFLLFAAIIHELAHFSALALLGAGVEQIELGLSGAKAGIRGETGLSYAGEFLAVAAGPATNILAAFVLAALGEEFSAQWLYIAAGANLVLGLFNLLPMRRLDGGRLMMIILLNRLYPDSAERVCRVVSWVILSLVSAGAVIFGLNTGMYAPLISALIYFAANFLEEIRPRLEKNTK